MRLPTLDARSRFIPYTFERVGGCEPGRFPLQGNHTGSSIMLNTDILISFIIATEDNISFLNRSLYSSQLILSAWQFLRSSQD